MAKAKAKYKTHEKLGISFAEYGALIAVREMLVTGLLQYFPGNHLKDKTSAHIFNMDTTCNINEHCGSIGCIGGNMALIMSRDDNDSYLYVRGQQERNTPLGDLFFPPDEYDWRKVTAEQAVKAIDNFLTTKKPKWKTILTKAQLEK